MKINLEKIKELEKNYQNSTISINTLQSMVEIVMSKKNNEFSESYILASNTLEDLGVIEYPPKIQPAELLKS